MSEGREGIPLVTITVPAYNHARYVQEALRSVIDQDYPRIELIVIDDGSTDETWARIQEMRSACESRFERVVMLKRKNRGCMANVQELIGMKRGAFIGFIASDDKYLPGAVSTLVRALESDPGVGVAVGTNLIIDGEGKRCYWDAELKNVSDPRLARFDTFDAFIAHGTGIGPDSDFYGSYAAFARCNHIPNGQLWRSSCLDAIRFQGVRAPLEDLWFNLQVSKIARFRHVGAATFAYRWHGCNTNALREHMLRLTEQTYFWELKTLERMPDPRRWADVFLPLHPRFETEVLKLWKGKRLQVSVIRIRTWRRAEYLLEINGERHPLFAWQTARVRPSPDLVRRPGPTAS